jgi:hypothetical protein
MNISGRLGRTNAIRPRQPAFGHNIQGGGHKQSNNRDLAAEI